MKNQINERFDILEKKTEEITLEINQNKNGEELNNDQNNQVTPIKIPESQHIEK